MHMMDKKSPGSNNPHDMPRPLIYKGRGAISNHSGRFEKLQHTDADDGWDNPEQDLAPIATEVLIDNTRSIINWNNSPDVPFDRSINPYRGCEHGCIYCFARPSHTYLGLSAGLDFESRILIKPDAAKLLRKELSNKHYHCMPIAMGTNTDPYQPLEKQQQITRQVLQVLAAFKHPVSIVTKSAMVERDIDILAEMASAGLAQVFISVTTLSNKLSRSLEPRAAAPQRRLETIRRLHEAGIPTGVMTAPIIPVLTDPELEKILTAAHEAGATNAGYVLLRLPLEVAPLFEEWLMHHYPLKANHVMSIIRQSRDGKNNQADFHERMRGTGLFADMVRQRFSLMTKKLGLNKRSLEMNTVLFKPPERPEQLGLF